jgi:hypothetical protein
MIRKTTGAHPGCLALIARLDYCAGSEPVNCISGPVAVGLGNADRKFLGSSVLRYSYWTDIAFA